MPGPRAKTQDHADAIAWLELAGALVSNEGLFLLWLANADEEQQEVLLEAEALILKLQMRTQWEQGVLLDQLGCTPRTRAAVPNMTAEQLGACRDYFSWVWDLVEQQNNYSLCRKIVQGAWTFFRVHSLDLDHVRQAFGFVRQNEGDEWRLEDGTVLDKLAAGDLDAAWSAASSQHTTLAVPAA